MNTQLLKAIEKIIDRKLAVAAAETDRKLGVYTEYIDAKINGLTEAFQIAMSIMAKDSDLQEVKQDVKTVKTAVKATNQDVRQLQIRVTRLEAKA